MDTPTPKKRPRILVLWNRTEESESLPVAHPDPEQLAAVEAALREDGWEVSLCNLEDDVDRLGHAVVVHRPALVLNLVDHFYGDDTQHPAVAGLLDLFGYPYTGSDPLCLGTCQDRVRTHLMLADTAVQVPGFAVVRDVNAIPDTDHLRPPLIVSQAFDDIYFEESSRRRLETREELESQVSELFTEFELPLLIEELREGRHLSAVVVGHRVIEVLPLVEHGWDEESEVETVQLAQLDLETVGRVHQQARRVFRIFGCRDVCRIDFAVDEENEIYCTNIRPAVDLVSPGGVFRTAAEHSDYGYESVLNQVVRSAYKRVPAAEAPVAEAPARPAAEEASAGSQSGSNGTPEGAAGAEEQPPPEPGAAEAED